MEKVTINMKGVKEKEINTIGAMLSHISDANELTTEIYGELDDESLLLSGIGAFNAVVEELKKRHQDSDEEMVLDEICKKSSEILSKTNVGELIGRIAEALDDDGDENELVNQPAGENPFASLLSFGSNEGNKEQGPSVLKENISVSPILEAKDDPKPITHLKVVTVFKKLDGQPPELESSLEGYGQIQDIIEMGCANYTYAINYANEKWLELLPDSNPLLVNLQTSQKAAELLMKYQLGDAGEMMGQMLPDLFDSFFGKQEESNDE